MKMNDLVLYIQEFMREAELDAAHAFDREKQAKARGAYGACATILNKIKKG